MKYIIMCGSRDILPRHLMKINNETLVERTIRLLRENNVSDIAITTNNNGFDGFGVPVLHHKNPCRPGHWLDCFYLMDEPVCYVFGDVVFSPKAIKTIVDTQTTSIQFFASAPPYDKRYIKTYAEPFAFKVVDTKKFRQCIDTARMYDDHGKFNRHPIAWELWQVIKGHTPNSIQYNSYVHINDYTCDADSPEQLDLIVRNMT